MKNIKFSVSIIYNRKKQLLKNGTALIQIVVCINGKRKYFSTNIYIKPDEWNDRQKKIKNNPNAAARNNEIYNKIIDIENFISSKINAGEQPTLLQVENHINQVQIIDFIDFVEKQADKENVTTSTKNSYKSLIKHLKEYQKGRKLFFEDVNYKFVKDFNLYLQNKVDINSVAVYFKKLKKFVKIAVNFELIEYKKNPFNQFKIKEIERKRNFLTIEEFKKIQSFKPASEKEKYVKDIYIFSCYTGLRHTDIKTLTKSDLITTNNEIYIYKTQDKTDINVNIPISTIADGKPLKILQEYESESGYFTKYNLTIINKVLKNIAAKVGINKNITFHSARHTNATILLNSGVAITSVQKLLGHRNIKTTLIYAETLNETIKNEIKKVVW